MMDSGGAVTAPDTVSGDRRVYRYSARRRIWGEMPSLNNFEDAALSARQAEPAEIINASMGGAALVPAGLPQPRVDETPPLPPTFAALDLGTNNCRLLVARPSYSGAGLAGFRIVDSFSRIVRLGEGVSQTGRLAESAIQRTLEALAICRAKMEARHVTRARLIATEACRMAENGQEFIDRARDALGLELEIIDRQTEARLAATGCAALADAEAESVVLFDIGGGSSEVIWLGRQTHDAVGAGHDRIRFWVSLKLGVVTLAEKFGGVDVSHSTFEAMVAHVAAGLEEFVAQSLPYQRCGRFHLLGTSGTVTTIGGIFLNLPRYDRRRVDGLWMSDAEIDTTVKRLRHMSYAERAANGCIGVERADLVLAGCAILEAIRRAFPARRVRIADRGLREGILLQLMDAEQARSSR
jgi:exopolyphosphatase/guanosine-5'-triphosphate,3'-diphosphate pyrophosphatase